VSDKDTREPKAFDFCSALYLGLNHARRELPDWNRLTLGKPAALEEAPSARRVAAKLAALQGCEQGVLGVSTLHLLWDWFGIVARSSSEVFLDAGAYPVARWGAERALSLGAPVREFRHHNPAHLSLMLSRAGRGRKPIVLTDGMCPACGTAAPLLEYWRAVRRYDGLLVIDDTQALGIWGKQRSSHDPFGHGGGGSLHSAQLERKEGIVVISSLAKAFGAPVAALASSGRAVREFVARSETRIHTSPPSLANVAAATRALSWNQIYGDPIRNRLVRLVRLFRRRVFEELGVLPVGGCFPVQSLCSVDGLGIQQALREHGIEALLLRERRTHPGIRVSFLLRADHSAHDIEAVAGAIASCKEALCLS
jgi:8-amino-7-oxononanoate synthase